VPANTRTTGPILIALLGGRHKLGHTSWKRDAQAPEF